MIHHFSTVSYVFHLIELESNFRSGTLMKTKNFFFQKLWKKFFNNQFQTHQNPSISLLFSANVHVVNFFRLSE